MNGKERDVLTMVETNQKWIMENVKEIKSSIANFDKRCDKTDKAIISMGTELTNHMSWHKGREAIKIAVASAASSAATGLIISALAGLI
jgi:hypothetical protein